MVKGTNRGSVKDDGGAVVGTGTSRRATAPRRQPPHGVGTRLPQSPSLTPCRSPSLRARQSPSAIALFLSKKGKGKHVRREAGLPHAQRVSNTTRCSRLGRVVLTLGELRRITKDFFDDQLIGEGAFGKVYKGVLTNGDVIAVKRFASTITGLQDVQYENEAQHLMRLKHPNIVQLVGYCSETEMKLVRYNGTFVRAEETERLLCLEYMPKKKSSWSSFRSVSDIHAGRAKKGLLAARRRQREERACRRRTCRPVSVYWNLVTRQLYYPKKGQSSTLVSWFKSVHLQAHLFVWMLGLSSTICIAVLSKLPGIENGTSRKPSSSSGATGGPEMSLVADRGGGDCKTPLSEPLAWQQSDRLEASRQPADWLCFDMRQRQTTV